MLGQRLILGSLMGVSPTRRVRQAYVKRTRADAPVVPAKVRRQLLFGTFLVDQVQ